MKIRVNTEIIEKLNPCDSSLENWLRFYKDFDGDIQQFIKLACVSDYEKMWVIMRLIPDELKELFVLDCAIGLPNLDPDHFAVTLCRKYAEDAIVDNFLDIYWFKVDYALLCAKYALLAHGSLDADIDQFQVLSYLIATHKETK